MDLSGLTKFLLVNMAGRVRLAASCHLYIVDVRVHDCFILQRRCQAEVQASLNDSVQHASIVRPARRLQGALTSSQVLEKAAPTA